MVYMITKEIMEDLLDTEFEQTKLELETVARNVNGDWVLVTPAQDEAEEDVTIEADRIELLETNNIRLNYLETRMLEITDARARLVNNEFGICETCGKEIETDRIEKNPTARTCKEHME